ncbi:hypothetical protein [Mucilaginibacter endophyticus]|uniref:hypothetical protein n=1 Tax=Mucilaginibacter endophyticus TaxID=2675003 RepID=UPI000E0D6C31|nr:hypothetical protein [Mucilaginibacter endophyticus]
MDRALCTLQDLIRQTAANSIDINSSLINFDLLADEARSAWASMLFSNTSNQSITRYASYYMRELDKCLISLSSIMTINSDTTCFDFTNPTAVVEKFFFILNSFLEDFADFVGETPACPQSYHFYVCTSIRSECHSIERWLSKISVNKIIGDMITSYLLRMNDFANYRFQYAEIAYYQKFVRELKFWSLINMEGDCTQVLIEKLIELNFNHLDLFNFRQQQIRAKFERLNPRSAISVVRQELLKIPYQEKRNTLRLDNRWSPTGEMLCNWLTGELNSFETQLDADSKISQNLQKLPFQLSVAHLACLIRLFAKEHIFGEITLTEIFNFFGRNCSSKRQSVISAGGISKEFYSMSQVVAAEMRDILQRMINRINRDYFPVVVVMLLTIGVC